MQKVQAIYFGKTKINSFDFFYDSTADLNFSTKILFYQFVKFLMFFIFDPYFSKIFLFQLKSLANSETHFMVFSTMI